MTLAMELHGKPKTEVYFKILAYATFISDFTLFSTLKIAFDSNPLQKKNA